MLQQLAGPMLFFLLVLTGVIWLSQSLRFVDLIINKGLSAGYFLYLTMLLLPSVIAIILPLAIFAGALYGLHRLAGDSEIVVMRSAGLSPWALARGPLLLAVGGTLAMYMLTLWLMPLGARTFKDMRISLRTDVSYVLLQEGAFNTIGSNLTVYIRSREQGNVMRGILVHDASDRSRPVTMMAERGALVNTDDGPRFIMVNGNRQELDRNADALSLLYFDRYTLDLGQFIHRDQARWLEPEERYLPELFEPGDTPDDIANAGTMLAEAHDRLTAPFYPLAFVLIALAAAMSGEFNRRSSNWRPVAAVGIVVLVRAAGLGFVNAAGKEPLFIPLIYLNLLLAIGLAAWLVNGGRPGRLRAAGAG